jgi:hypothetical protein
MIVEEGDAGEFWCPQTRIYNPISKVSGYNAVTFILDTEETDSLNETVAYCRGARCMMWRYVNHHPDSFKGYCGLAGKPSLDD